ncbi:hypothetical protein EK21DRAFT_97654 [Setomelanomma holmii]|uniref:Uncharacterized protein n=1 Tax=Setomelanomma holmii TaxID=210430 RepID=A0A9P4HHL6_9PLEO|nr:hypothetical protein EK21DRAFT_97654 [Setomelanomma holmii]
MPLIRPLQPAATTPSTPQTEEFPTLPPCPRPNHVGGHNDWLQITSPKAFPDCDVCPDCYNAAFRNTRYAACFSTDLPTSKSSRLPKPENVIVQCDFSEIWTRITYKWLFAQKAPNLNLMASLADVPRDEDGACLNLNLEDAEVKKGGKATATRRWYCLRDPTTNSLMEELTVCSDCVAHVNRIFPPLTGLFELLITLGHGFDRCMDYIDRIIETTQKTFATGIRNITPLAEYIRAWAVVSVCKKGASVIGEYNYLLPSTIPGFTACEECYMKHIKPWLGKEPRPAVLSGLDRAVPPPGQFFMCDLFSPRSQQYFREACATDDLQTYRHRLAQRNDKMREIDMQLVRMKQQSQQLERQSESQMSMMRVEQMRASSRSTSYIGTGWIAPRIDWSATNALMNRANQLSIQAAGVLDDMTLLEKE